MKYFSATKSGFFDTTIHGEREIEQVDTDGEGAVVDRYMVPNPNCLIPLDAKELSEEEYQSLMEWQSKGRSIKFHGQARPYNEEPPARTLASAKEDKLAALAAARYQRETAGLIIGPATIMTDRASQAMITGAYVAVQIDPTRQIDFKGADGWIKIGAPMVMQIAAAVSSHVQAHFTAERAHAEAIEALGTIETIDAYDIETGW